MELTQFNLNEKSIPIYSYKTLSSTNLTLRSLIESSVKLPLAVIAENQTAGKGQWGRVWQSKEGGLYLSVGIAFTILLEDALLLTLMASWGITQILNREAIPVKLKWPNDLLLQGRKLGGIKIETCSKGNLISQIIVGVGINWHNETPLQAINLRQYPHISSLEQLTHLTIEGIFLGLERYEQIGVEDSLSLYLKNLDSMGKKVQIEGQTGTVSGINNKGQLKVLFSSPGASCEIYCWPGMISLGYY